MHFSDIKWRSKNRYFLIYVLTTHVKNTKLISNTYSKNILLFNLHLIETATPSMLCFYAGGNTKMPSFFVASDLIYFSLCIVWQNTIGELVNAGINFLYSWRVYWKNRLKCWSKIFLDIRASVQNEKKTFFNG